MQATIARWEESLRRKQQDYAFITDPTQQDRMQKEIDALAGQIAQGKQILTKLPAATESEEETVEPTTKRRKTKKPKKRKQTAVVPVLAPASVPTREVVFVPRVATYTAAAPTAKLLMMKAQQKPFIDLPVFTSTQLAELLTAEEEIPFFFATPEGVRLIGNIPPALVHESLVKRYDGKPYVFVAMPSAYSPQVKTEKAQKGAVKVSYKLQYEWASERVGQAFYNLLLGNPSGILSHEEAWTLIAMLMFFGMDVTLLRDSIVESIDNTNVIAALNLLRKPVFRIARTQQLADELVRTLSQYDLGPGNLSTLYNDLRSQTDIAQVYRQLQQDITPQERQLQTFTTLEGLIRFANAAHNNSNVILPLLRVWEESLAPITHLPLENLPAFSQAMSIVRSDLALGVLSSERLNSLYAAWLPLVEEIKKSEEARVLLNPNNHPVRAKSAVTTAIYQNPTWGAMSEEAMEYLLKALYSVSPAASPAYPILLRAEEVISTQFSLPQGYSDQLLTLWHAYIWQWINVLFVEPAEGSCTTFYLRLRVLFKMIETSAAASNKPKPLYPTKSGERKTIQLAADVSAFIRTACTKRESEKDPAPLISLTDIFFAVAQKVVPLVDDEGDKVFVQNYIWFLLDSICDAQTLEENYARTKALQLLLDTAAALQ